MYDSSGFIEWLNDLPDTLGEDETGPTWGELGLKPDSPQSAKDAYTQYLQDKKQATQKGTKL